MTTRRDFLVDSGEAAAAIAVTAALPVAAGALAPTPFDPAAWLAEADRLGTDVYLWPWQIQSADGTLGPLEWSLWQDVRGRTSDDIHLWRWLRGDLNTAEANQQRLWEYMEDIGRYGPRRWPSRWSATRRPNVEAA